MQLVLIIGGTHCSVIIVDWFSFEGVACEGKLSNHTVKYRIETLRLYSVKDWFRWVYIRSKSGLDGFIFGQSLV